MSNLDAILSPEECRRRREAIGATVRDLGRRAMMSWASIRRFEWGELKFNGPTWRENLRDALEKMEAEFNDRALASGGAADEMLDGYRDGLRDAEYDFPDRLANRGASYRHGWLNGRDDRKRSPRSGAEDLRQQAKAAIEKDAMP